ncbi:phosphodiesterase [Streptomyces sp. NRRL B-1140]|uniref:alkaline phosphatase family protein n=1 Tax=Streptomyces sp. NRRL B-1140 TaxID=1415549 RepID=UPI0006ADFE31|nr:alkaline phosphatase family protein [Streptomyces sp. NRRL B-1140]KOV92711.1 phosphodiesterase [Streptomyces sp. NRRL B-1140]
MDGLRYDRLTRSPAGAPVLHRLMATGAHGTSLLPYGRADDEPSAGTAYTDSGPGWSSILTGVWPERHGVTGNDFKGAAYTRYPDFLTRAATARPGLRTVAAVSWPALVRRGTLGRAIGRRVRYNGESRGYETADRRVARTALRWLGKGDPDVMFVYFGATDEAGHATGPLSPAYDRALLAQDTHLGHLLDAIGARAADPRRAPERWTVLITTDHGHLDSGGHGGDSRAEREVFVILAERGAGEGPGGTRLDTPRLVDVAPTVLDRLGIPADPAWGLQGRVLPRPTAPTPEWP